MAKKQDNIPCVSPDRVAQLLSLGVGYEGYVTFKRDKTYVKIYPLRSVILRHNTTSRIANQKKHYPSGKYRINYGQERYVFKDSFLRYLPSEGVGVNGSFHISGYVLICKVSDGFIATVGVTAKSSAQNIGDLTFNGDVSLLSGSVVLGKNILTKPTNENIIASGWILVGTATINLPTSADNNISIDVHVGYIYDSGVGRAAASGKFKLEIGKKQ